MALGSKYFLRAFSPKMMTKAVNTFDRATTIVIIACWSAAFVAMAAAVYTITISISARRATEAAQVSEPILPKVVRKPMDVHTVQTMFDRMQKRFPDVVFSVHGTDLTVTSANGSRFHQWLTALSYIDTISPELHWSFQGFCVGDCLNSEIMHATLNGERVGFEAPADADSKK